MNPFNNRVITDADAPTRELPRVKCRKKELEPNAAKTAESEANQVFENQLIINQYEQVLTHILLEISACATEIRNGNLEKHILEQSLASVQAIRGIRPVTSVRAELKKIETLADLIIKGKPNKEILDRIEAVKTRLSDVMLGL